MSVAVSGRDRWRCAYVGIGSNLEQPDLQVGRAQRALADVSGVRVARVSRRWRTPPLGPGAQPDYCNAVAGVVTTLSPRALLDELLAIENRLGRVRGGERWSSRVIDLDLLMIPGVTVAGPALTLPHPEMLNRAFVLVPLAEIAPSMILSDGRSAAHHAAASDTTGMTLWPVVEAVA